MDKNPIIVLIFEFFTHKTTFSLFLAFNFKYLKYKIDKRLKLVKNLLKKINNHLFIEVKYKKSKKTDKNSINFQRLCFDKRL